MGNTLRTGKGERLFTSESVSEGHPDKICDQVSDGILDACLAQDPHARVACEVFATTDRLIVGGEITTTALIDIDTIARAVIHDIGYTEPGLGFDCNTVEISNYVKNQSLDIAMGVDESEGKPQGAGDQGMMFGYACDETVELMPAPVMYSHRLLRAASHLRRNKTLSWLRPDAKAQVTLRYREGKPVAIDTVVLSHQHDPSVPQQEIQERLLKEVVVPVLEPTGLFSKNTRCLVNPTGRFVTGGPQGDTGLTGRKIIVDTYGGMGRHGGGAFSGKDPSKVDRSAAYMARWIARTLVSQQLCTRCEIQLSYAIGVAQPVSVLVDTFNTGTMDDSDLANLVLDTFDLTPAGIIRSLDLLRPIYAQTASYGHFGKPGLPWESELPSLV